MASMGYFPPDDEKMRIEIAAMKKRKEDASAKREQDKVIKEEAAKQEKKDAIIKKAKQTQRNTLQRDRIYFDLARMFERHADLLHKVVYDAVITGTIFDESQLSATEVEHLSAIDDELGGMITSPFSVFSDDNDEQYKKHAQDLSALFSTHTTHTWKLLKIFEDMHFRDSNESVVFTNAFSTDITPENRNSNSTVPAALNTVKATDSPGSGDILLYTQKEDQDRLDRLKVFANEAVSIAKKMYDRGDAIVDMIHYVKKLLDVGSNEPSNSESGTWDIQAIKSGIEKHIHLELTYIMQALICRIHVMEDIDVPSIKAARHTLCMTSNAMYAHGCTMGNTLAEGIVGYMAAFGAWDISEESGDTCGISPAYGEFLRNRAADRRKTIDPGEESELAVLTGMVDEYNTNGVMVDEYNTTRVMEPIPIAPAEPIQDELAEYDPTSSVPTTRPIGTKAREETTRVRLLSTCAHPTCSSAAIARCSCGKVAYCGVECQTRDWHAGHNKVHGK